MKIVKKPWFIPIVLTILILLGSQLYTNQLIAGKGMKTEKEVQAQLETMYFGGKVEHVSMKESKYEAEITRDGSLYKAEVDGKTGKVLKLTQTKEAKPTSTVMGKDSPSKTATPAEPQEKPVIADKPAVTVSKPPADKTQTPAKPAVIKKEEAIKKPSPSPPVKVVKKAVHITEQQAINVALQKLNGEVNDVEYISTTDGGYYLVEIEIDVDDGPDEATYQIHAVSGKVMTVTWDD